MTRGTTGSNPKLSDTPASGILPVPTQRAEIKTKKLKDSIARARLYETCKKGIGDKKESLDWNQWLASDCEKLGKDSTKLKNIYPRLFEILTELKDSQKKAAAQKELAGIVDYLNEKEKRLQPISEEKAKLGKSVAIGKAQEMIGNLEKACGDMDTRTKILTGAVILGVAIVAWKGFFKKFFKHTWGRRIFGASAIAASFLVASEVVRTATKGKHSLGADTLGKTWNSISGGAAKAGEVVGRKENINFWDTVSEVSIEGDFTEEWAALGDIPLKDLIDLYERESKNPNPKNGIHQIDLSKIGLNKEQKNIVSGKDVYEMLREICSPNYESVSGHQPGGTMKIKTNWLGKEPPITFGNFLLEIANLGNPIGIPKDDFEELKKILRTEATRTRVTSLPVWTTSQQARYFWANWKRPSRICDRRLRSTKKSATRNNTGKRGDRLPGYHDIKSRHICFSESGNIIGKRSKSA